MFKKWYHILHPESSLVVYIKGSSFKQPPEIGQCNCNDGTKIALFRVPHYCLSLETPQLRGENFVYYILVRYTLDYAQDARKIAQTA